MSDMKNVTTVMHCMTRGQDRIYFEGLEYSAGSRVVQTATLDSGIFARNVGEKPVEITVSGHFDPTEIMFYTRFIRSFNENSGRLVIDGWIIEKPVLLEGTAEIKQGAMLGEYRIKFGRLDDD